MTDQQHLITPPPELVQQWAAEFWGYPGASIGSAEEYIATQAARWGADMELDACCEWVRATRFIDLDGHEALRTARRPKPPSLAEEALKELAWVDKNVNGPHLNKCDAVYTIRRALERLQELEVQGQLTKESY